jgi:ABC-type nitrate/sulfonate/bicarbonate transport system ATPase subunit
MAKVTVDRLVKVFPPPQKGGEPVRAITDIHFQVDGNVFVSIVGPSGCGKSTLLNILSGVERPARLRLPGRQAAAVANRHGEHAVRP